MEERIDNFNCFNQEFINLSSHDDKKCKSGKTASRAFEWHFCNFVFSITMVFAYFELLHDNNVDEMIQERLRYQEQIFATSRCLNQIAHSDQSIYRGVKNVSVFCQWHHIIIFSHYVLMVKDFVNKIYLWLEKKLLKHMGCNGLWIKRQVFTAHCSLGDFYLQQGLSGTWTGALSHTQTH